MKRKHYGLLSIALILLALIATVIYSIKISHKIAEEIRITKISPLPTIPVPDSATIKEIEGLEKRMTGLYHPHGSDISPINLSSFGYQPMKRPKVITKSRKIILPSHMDYSLTLAFSSGKKRFCVIDGTFYPEGASLPDGGKIARIEPRRVLVSKHRFQEWIPVRERIRD